MDLVPCIEEGLTSRLSNPLPSPLALPLYLSAWIAGLSPAHGCSVLPECAWRDQPSVARQRIRTNANVTGIPPNPRNCYGFAAWEGVLYVLGGTVKDMSSSVHS